MVSAVAILAMGGIVSHHTGSASRTGRRAGIDGMRFAELIVAYGVGAGLAVQPLVAARLSGPVPAAAPAQAPPSDDAMPAAFAAFEERLRQLERALPKCPLQAESGGSGGCVLNRLSGCIHLINVSGPHVPAEAWCTGCDWKFGRRSHKVLPERPPLEALGKRRLCEKCFPGEKWRRAGAEQHGAPRLPRRRLPRPPRPRPEAPAGRPGCCQAWGPHLKDGSAFGHKGHTPGSVQRPLPVGTPFCF